MLGQLIGTVRGARNALELFGSFELIKRVDEHVVLNVTLIQLHPAHVFFWFPWQFRASRERCRRGGVVLTRGETAAVTGRQELPPQDHG